MNHKTEHLGAGFYRLYATHLLLPAPRDTVADEALGGISLNSGEL